MNFVSDRRFSIVVGDMGVYGIAVLGFFSCGISVILILTCSIAVSSSSAVCGFSSFWLTVFGEIRLFTVLRYRLFALYRYYRYYRYYSYYSCYSYYRYYCVY